jgi:hypothetical protein
VLPVGGLQAGIPGAWSLLVVVQGFDAGTREARNGVAPLGRRWVPVAPPDANRNSNGADAKASKHFFYVFIKRSFLDPRQPQAYAL